MLGGVAYQRSLARADNCVQQPGKEPVSITPSGAELFLYQFNGHTTLIMRSPSEADSESCGVIQDQLPKGSGPALGRISAARYGREQGATGGRQTCNYDTSPPPRLI